MVDLAFKNLWYDKLRFAMTIAGVAFAVTLVLAQTGLFLGVLRNASAMIDHADADLWVTSRNTANVDFSQAFAEGLVDRVRSVPGVLRADNLIVTFMDVALPSGASELTEVLALEDFPRWRLPWEVTAGSVADVRRGRYLLIDESATKRFGAFRVGDYHEVQGHRLEIIGTTRHALSFTTNPVTFMDYRLAQTLRADLAGRTSYILVKLTPGADSAAVRREIARRLPYNDVRTKQAWSARSRRYWIDNTGLGCGSAVAWSMVPALLRLGITPLMPAWLHGTVFGGTVVLCLGAAVISFRKVASIDPALVFRA